MTISAQSFTEPGSDDLADRAYEVMGRAPRVLSSAAASVMKERGEGWIITVASVSALTRQDSYSALKAYALALTEVLALELIGSRFPHSQPGMLSGIFSIAVTGGMLAPATLGYFAQLRDIGVVMWLPLAGTVMVFILVLLIWLETKLSGKPLAP